MSDYEFPQDFPPRIATQEAAIDTLARTLWGEAYSDTVRGKEAVAAVVINRVHRARDLFGADWWGGTIVEACLSANQFQCWRRSPISRQELMQVRINDPIFVICRRIAARAARGALIDPTYGATHYHRIGEMPWWGAGKTPTVVIGRKKFYRDALADAESPGISDLAQDLASQDLEIASLMAPDPTAQDVLKGEAA